VAPQRARRFDILLCVSTFNFQFKSVLGICLMGGIGLVTIAQAPPAKSPSIQPASSTQSSAPPQVSAASQQATPPTNIIPRAGLNMVVIDPAHGGADAGGRGTEGIRESDVVLEFAAQLRKNLEAQGFQVVQTREGNDNPSFDDRSARANAQHGAVFVTLHVGSTGVTGTARVYVSPEFALVTDTTGLIPWERAQGPFVGLSHKLGDLVQGELAKRFKGSPATALVAPVRQLRTTAAPAIAVEISSVSVADRSDLERMIPGAADAIARGITDFKPAYVVPTVLTNPAGGSQ
jgi:N-acetylmuramoyl-L-alanine amidase